MKNLYIRHIIFNCSAVVDHLAHLSLDALAQIIITNIDVEYWDMFKNDITAFCRKIVTNLSPMYMQQIIKNLPQVEYEALLRSTARPPNTDRTTATTIVIPPSEPDEVESMLAQLDED